MIYKFKSADELIAAFSSMPKNKPIDMIQNNGALTQYLQDTLLDSIEIIYYKENVIRNIFIGLKQGMDSRKIKYIPSTNFEIKFVESQNP